MCVAELDGAVAKITERDDEGMTATLVSIGILYPPLNPARSICAGFASSALRTKRHCLRCHTKQCKTVHKRILPRYQVPDHLFECMRWNVIRRAGSLQFGQDCG